MKAIYIEQHGVIDNVKAIEVPTPSIKDGEVLVKIEASGINPSDIASIEGRFPGSVLPRIVGRDFAGRVVGGPPGLLGADVWGTGGDLGISRNWTHAEYVGPARIRPWRVDRRIFLFNRPLVREFRLSPLFLLSFT